jgi:epoxyqueuosine reductase QueG
MSDTEDKQAEDCKTYCLDQGAEMVGIADLKPLKEGLSTEPKDLLSPYTSAISIAVTLDMKAVAEMHGEPTPEYADNCKDINARLNNMTESIVDWIKSKGFKAEAVPASKKLVEGGTEGSVSHKAIAIMAGLGWQGKNLLLVTPQYGPRVRLSSVLTDMPLTFDSPIKNRCGRCISCVEACPAGAIRNVNTEFHYSDRNEAIDLDKCHNNTLKYMDVPGVGYTFCGQCIPVCPHGRKLMLKEAGFQKK